MEIWSDFGSGVGSGVGRKGGETVGEATELSEGARGVSGGRGVPTYLPTLRTYLTCRMGKAEEKYSVCT